MPTCIAVNTVALLFLTDIDNVAYGLGLSERVRDRVEVAGRVELSESDLTWLVRAKIAHMVAIVVGINAGVTTRSTAGLYWVVGFYWLAGLVASIGGSLAETAKRMATTTVAWAAGTALLTLGILHGGDLA